MITRLTLVLALAQDAPLGQKGDRVRFIVFDQGSNAVGSITIPMDAITQG